MKNPYEHLRTDSYQRSRWTNHNILLPPLLQIQRHSPIPRLDGRPPCWSLFTLHPFSRESHGFPGFPPFELPSQQLMALSQPPSPPGIPWQATWTREAGMLTADLHPSLQSNKSNPQSHPLLCSRIAVAISPSSMTPAPHISNRLHRSSPNFLTQTLPIVPATNTSRPSLGPG